MFIDCQPNWTPENYSKHNRLSQEQTSDIKEYQGKQQRYFNPPTKYSACESYRQCRHVPTYPTYIKYESESYYNFGNIPYGIPPISAKYVPRFTRYTAQEYLL